MNQFEEVKPDRDQEAVFVNTFLPRERRERWLTQLASEKGRPKLLSRLAHTFHQDLDPRFMYEKDAPATEINAPARLALRQWEEKNPKQQCYVIATHSEVDGQTMTLAEAEADPRLTFGAILLLVPNKLAYYHPERSNLSNQPRYLLYHP